MNGYDYLGCDGPNGEKYYFFGVYQPGWNKDQYETNLSYRLRNDNVSVLHSGNGGMLGDMFEEFAPSSDLDTILLQTWANDNYARLHNRYYVGPDGKVYGVTDDRNLVPQGAKVVSDQSSGSIEKSANGSTERRAGHFDEATGKWVNADGTTDGFTVKMPPFRVLDDDAPTAVPDFQPWDGVMPYKHYTGPTWHQSTEDRNYALYREIIRSFEMDGYGDALGFYAEVGENGSWLGVPGGSLVEIGPAIGSGIRAVGSAKSLLQSPEGKRLITQVRLAMAINTQVLSFEANGARALRNVVTYFRTATKPQIVQTVMPPKPPPFYIPPGGG